VEALLPRAGYAGLSEHAYLNQASLGAIPMASRAAMTAFLVDVAQHGNVKMSDAAETVVLDDLQQGHAGLPMTELQGPERPHEMSRQITSI